MNDNTKGFRVNVYFDKLSYSVLEQLKTMTGINQSSLIRQMIIDKGIDEGIVELAEVRDSLYEENRLVYKYTQQQTKFEGMLSTTRREIAEYSCKTEKDIRSLELALNDIERMSYQLRDMMNSMLKYSIEESPNGFKSADEKMREYEPHLYTEKSAENYDKLQERFAVEKANDARRSSHT